MSKFFFFKVLNTIAEVNDQAPRSPTVGFVFCPVEKWAHTLHHTEVRFYSSWFQLVPAGLKQGGCIFLRNGGVHFPFPGVWRKLFHIHSHTGSRGRQREWGPPGCAQCREGWPADFSCSSGIPGTAVELTVCNSPRRPPLCGLSRR